MIPKFTKPMLGFLLMVLLGLYSHAQEKEDQITVKITRDVDGASKTFEKTYDSEEEMQKDEELKNFIGEENQLNFMFSDDPKNIEWHKNGSGQSFLFNFDQEDQEDMSRHFKFFQHGDSLSKEFELKMGLLDEHLKGLDIKIKEHMLDIEDGHGYVFSIGDDEHFRWNLDDSIADKIQLKIAKGIDADQQVDFDFIVVKKLRISEDVAGFGKKGMVKPNDQLKLDNLKFYPNPSPNGRFKIRFDTPGKGELSIKVYNLDGKQIYNRYFGQYSGEYAESIDLSAQNEGIYLLEVEFDGKRLTRKIAID